MNQRSGGREGWGWRRVVGVVALGVVAGLLASCGSRDTAIDDPNPGGVSVEREAPTDGPAAMAPSLRAAYITSVQRDASAAYRFSPLESHGTRADNPRQRLRAAVTPDGLELEPSEPSAAARAGSSWRVQLGLSAIGRGDRVEPLPERASPPALQGNRAALDHGDGLVEWFVNGPLGCEQGFELARRPEAGQGELMLHVEVRGLRPVLVEAGQAVSLRTAAGERVLRYSDLHARDARGRQLPTQMAVVADRIALAVDDRGASYPLHIDPLIWTELKKIIPSDPEGGAYFGVSVAVDGTTAVVAAPLHPGGGTMRGAAYVFYRDQGGSESWGEVKKLTASDAADDDLFGYSAAVSGDVIVVGASGNDGAGGAGADRGAAYVFHRDHGGTDNWGEVKQIVPTDPEDDAGFGKAVAASGDSILVGAPTDDGTGGADADRGAAYVFDRDQGGTDNWGQVKKLAASDAADGDEFGDSVALDGDVAVVGASNEDGAGTSRGAAYVFYRDQGSADNWGEVRKLTADDAADADAFGVAVAVTSGVILVGAKDKGASSTRRGAAYLFYRDQGGADLWGQVRKLVPSDLEDQDRFGAAVGVSGAYALVSSEHEGGAGSGRGAAYLFGKDEGGTDQWGELDKVIASDAADGDGFGVSVALSGTTAIVGAPFEDGAGTDRGAAYVLGLRSEDGDSCSQDEQCASGHCVDDVCCADSCGGGDPNDCQACSASAGGTAADGVCSTVSDGATCSDGLFCNGTETCTSGTCGGSTGDPCAGNLGDADDDCSEACDEAADACSAADMDGSSCDDGTFCNGDDSCQDGACSVHAGDPCPGPDGDDDCAESCEELGQVCTASDPDGASCGSEPNWGCLDGQCRAPDGHTCTEQTECLSTFCVNERCCDEPECEAYICGADGHCLQSCTSTADCAPGFGCEADGQCRSSQPTTDTTADEGGCDCRFAVGRAGRRGLDVTGAWLAALAVAIGATRRRRRRRGPRQASARARP